MAVAALTLTLSSPVQAGGDGCRPEPASVWAPAGYVCPPRYGYGTASRYPGEYAAMNFCSWEVRTTQGCGLVKVTSLLTGVTVITEVGEWCHCYVGVTGPHGETERLIDLTPDLVAALGLDWNDGLFDVTVEPVDAASGLPEQVLLPNTALGVH